MIRREEREVGESSLREMAVESVDEYESERGEDGGAD